MQKGYAYKAEDGIYFSIEKYQKDFGDYGSLVGDKFIEGKKVGARVAVDEYEKDNLSDFALWKAHSPETDAQIFWDHPQLGKGRPGWHIECSVINQVAFKGEATDIHTGGVDLIFPHHTNEIAQSQALLGKGNFVKHWFHSEHLQVEGQRMGKRFNNFFTVRDLSSKVPLAGIDFAVFVYPKLLPRAAKLYNGKLYMGSYKALEKLYNTLKAHKIIGENQELQQNFIDEYKAKAESALSSDLNIPSFVAQAWEVLGSKSISIRSQDEILKNNDQVLAFKLESSPSIFEDIEMPEEIKILVEQRQRAREQKDFLKSDEFRKQIEALGYEVMDTAEGQKARKKI